MRSGGATLPVGPHTLRAEDEDWHESGGTSPLSSSDGFALSLSPFKRVT